MKKLILFLTIFLLTIISCNRDNSPDPNPNNDPAFSFNFGNSASRSFSGLILDTGGNPITNATVTIGTSATQTNSKGMFMLKNASVQENFAYIKVTKSGFADGTRTLVPTTGLNRVDIMMIPLIPVATIASGSTNTVSLPNGTQIKFDGAFQDANGAAYSGNVQVSLYHLKPSDNYFSELMPGSLLASASNGDPKYLESYGMINVDLKGSSGQKLNIANGHTAEVSMAIDPAQTTVPNTIPLWYFDEAKGYWKEEGSATKVGNKYVGNVAHFSWWNCDYPQNQCILKVKIQNSSGQPVSSVRVDLIPSSGFGRSGISDTNGDISGIIPAGQTLTMKVINECGNVLISNVIGPFVTNSVNNLPIITIPSTNILTITGTLKDCSNSNVTDGIVYLKKLGSASFFSVASYPVTNGSFTFNTLLCTNSQQFQLEGTDFGSMQVSGSITFIGTAPSTNVGIINTCTSTNEFITYQVDNGPVRNIITGITASYNAASNSMVIMTPQANPYFLFESGQITGVGNYTCNPNQTLIQYTNNSGNISGITSGTTVVAINQIGNVGGYIDATVNGTFTDTSGSHTITGTIHVIRDN